MVTLDKLEGIQEEVVVIYLKLLENVEKNLGKT
jgi:hypothetical protein